MDLRTKERVEKAEAVAQSLWDKRDGMKGRPALQDTVFTMMEELRTAARRARDAYKQIVDFTEIGSLGGASSLLVAANEVALCIAVLDSLTKVAEFMLKDITPA